MIPLLLSLKCWDYRCAPLDNLSKLKLLMLLLLCLQLSCKLIKDWFLGPMQEWCLASEQALLCMGQEPAKQALIALVLSLVSPGAQCTMLLIVQGDDSVVLDWAAVGSGPCFKDHSRWLHGDQLTLSTRTCWHLERHPAAGGMVR